MLSKVTFIFGCILLFHAGYSAVQHKSILKLHTAEIEHTGLPHDITLECLFASVLCCFAVLEGMTNFKDYRITSDLHIKKLGEAYHKQNFMIFNHRGSHS